jgi:hypothetical protein
MRIRRKRWRTGLVSTGRGDWRRKPIPKVNKNYKGNRKRTRTKDKRGNRRETGDIGNSGELETNGRNRICAEKDDEKTTKRRETEGHETKGYDEERKARITET